MEENIGFPSEGNDIEGRLEKGDENKGVVITHPHPLYGGDMDNCVVETIRCAYRKRGHTTLRFNFRGVGKSQGRYDEGKGELRDVLAAISYLAEIGIQQVDLAGYSFGAWVNAQMNFQNASVRNMVMVSPPVAFMDFQTVGSIACLRLVITGTRDEIAPQALIQKLLPAWNKTARFELISGSDHFYTEHLQTLESVLLSFL